MIDQKARSDLATCLDRLIAGEMTNDEFDDCYYERWHDSGDAAVAEIATFGWSLYSSDLGWSYRLRGRHAVCDEERQAAQRAILFLHTNLEYEWPRNVTGAEPYWGLWSPGAYLIFGMIFLCCGGVHLGFARSVWRIIDSFGTVLVGLLATIPTVHWLLTYRRKTEELRQFTESGDVTVWPFLRGADLERAQGLQTNP
jgi:hypothetical protein